MDIEEAQIQRVLSRMCYLMLFFTFLTAILFEYTEYTNIQDDPKTAYQKPNPQPRTGLCTQTWCRLHCSHSSQRAGTGKLHPDTQEENRNVVWFTATCAHGSLAGQKLQYPGGEGDLDEENKGAETDEKYFSPPGFLHLLWKQVGHTGP